MKIPLFLLATVALEAICVISTNPNCRIFAKGDFQRDSLINVYVSYGSQAIDGDITLSYGSCIDPKSLHPIIHFHASSEHRPEKFAWHVPAEAESGCFYAIDASGNTVAQSELYTAAENPSKRGHPELSGMYFNAIKYYKDHDISKHPYASGKNKRIGIVGAGMSGLFSGFLLDQAGFHNYEILEASDRIGGRVHTTYFGNSETAYQEMGPMRFPFEYEYDGETLPIMDHRIVFQLAEELNTLNDESYKIELIKWHQKGPNNLYYKHGFRLPDGRIPTVGEVQDNPSLVPAGPDVSALTEEINRGTKDFINGEWFKLLGTDLHAAYEKALEQGYEDWSEMGWLHNKMSVSLNATLYHVGLDKVQLWEDMYDTFTFGHATNWKTVQGGLSRIPRAFGPLLGDKVIYGKHITKLDYKGNTVSVQWKESPYDTQYKSRVYDTVFVAVPFSIVRTWHLPQLDFTLDQAIRNLKYTQACKVALSFSKRFWEHLDRPIHGGCDQTDLLSGQICYPSNNIGSNGTGVVLANYVKDEASFSFAAMTEEQHVGRAIEDFTELHGSLVQKYYTGEYSRRCWSMDPLAGGHCAKPLPGQSKLYMPSYFEINHGLIFIGDHTDIKNNWISAALDSAIRGVVMILVDSGHIDEAKAIVNKYNAKWLRI